MAGETQDPFDIKWLRSGRNRPVLQKEDDASQFDAGTPQNEMSKDEPQKTTEQQGEMRERKKLVFSTPKDEKDEAASFIPRKLEPGTEDPYRGMRERILMQQTEPINAANSGMGQGLQSLRNTSQYSQNQKTPSTVQPNSIGSGINLNPFTTSQNTGMPLPYTPGNSMGNARFKDRKPPTYDGKTSFKDYWVQFEMVSTLNGWDKSRAAYELAASLNGVAREILTDLNPAERGNLESLFKALQIRFEPENQTQIYRVQLRQRLRKPDESFPELAHDIKRLVRKANPDLPSTMRDRLAKEAFMDAINDKDLQWAVFQGHPKNVDQAVAIAMEYEAIQKTRVPLVERTNQKWGENKDENTEIVDKINGLLAKLDKVHLSSVAD